MDYAREHLAKMGAESLRKVGSATIALPHADESSNLRWMFLISSTNR